MKYLNSLRHTLDETEISIDFINKNADKISKLKINERPQQNNLVAQLQVQVQKITQMIFNTKCFDLYAETIDQTKCQGVFNPNKVICNVIQML